jgi:hypothetical protein
MKIKILFLSVILTCILSSCEQSKKGAWTKTDKEKCQSELMKGMKKTKEYAELKTMFKIEDDQFSKCFCDKIEGRYESFWVYDLKNNMETKKKEATELFLSCMGKDGQ